MVTTAPRPLQLPNWGIVKIHAATRINSITRAAVMLTLGWLLATVSLPANANTSYISRLPADVQALLQPIQPVFTPRKVQVTGSSLSQRVLDDSLKNFSKDISNSTYSDTYLQAEKLLTKGAFVTDEALVNSLWNTSGEDFRSFQTLYLNGGFDRKAMDNMQYGVNKCDWLRMAIYADFGGTNAEMLAASIQASEQNTLFLIDKFNFKLCADGYLDHFAFLIKGDKTPVVPRSMHLLLKTKQVNPQKLMNEFFKSLHRGKFSIERQATLAMLLDAGAKISSNMVGNYVGGNLHKGSGLSSSEQADWLNRYKIGLAMMVESQPAITGVLKTELERMAENAAKPDTYTNDQKTKQYFIKLNEVTLAAFNTASGGNFQAQQADTALQDQMAEAIDQRDHRRVDFYMQRGVKPTSGLIYKATHAGMETQALKMLEAMPGDLDTVRLGRAAVYGKSYAVFDVLLSRDLYGGKGQEAELLALIKAGQTERATQLMQRGADPDAVMTLALRETDLGLVGTAVQLCGKVGERRLAEHNRLAAAERDKRKKEALAQEKAEIQARELIEAQYRQPKQVGEKVCRDGGHLFGRYTIKAFVEQVQGQRIQLRISYSGGYIGTEYAENRLVWSEYWDWRACQ